MNGYAIVRSDGTMLEWRRTKTQANSVVRTYSLVHADSLHIREMEYNDYLKEVWG